MLFSEIVKEASNQVNNSNMNIEILQGYIEKFDIKEKEKKILIRVNQKLVLSKEALIFSETAYGKMQEKDNVILIKCKGGQKYYVIDKVAVIDDSSNKQYK